MTAGSDFERALLRETYALHQIFMVLGYAAEEIWLGLGPGIGEALDGEPVGGRHCLSVHLKRGGASFTVLVAPLDEAAGQRFLDVWDDFCRHGKRAASQAELDALLYESHAYRRHFELVQGLATKGFFTGGASSDAN